VRPNVVLYGEPNPVSDDISSIMAHDLKFGPDLLLIMGTSLKVHGIKNLVKEFAKSVHSKKNGKVVFINQSQPAESSWKDVIDYWVEVDCDEWAHDKSRMKQTELSFKSMKGSLSQPLATNEKENIPKTPSKRKFGQKTSEIETPKMLPTPPSTGRRALKDLSSSKKTRHACSTRTVENQDVIMLQTPSYSSGSGRKRRRVDSDFKIWESTESSAEDSVDLELSNEPIVVVSTPCRGKKRKLA
jgi:hypothetical protein